MFKFASSIMKQAQGTITSHMLIQVKKFKVGYFTQVRERLSWSNKLVYVQFFFFDITTWLPRINIHWTETSQVQIKVSSKENNCSSYDLKIAYLTYQ